MSGVFALWFASGVVMMYSSGMPWVTPDERLRRAEPVTLGAVRCPPAQAARVAGVESPEEMRLEQLLDRPLYRVDDAAVYADTCAPFDPLSDAQALDLAGRFAGAAQLQPVETLQEVDQWTLFKASALPLLRIRVEGSGEELYVSPRQGRVVQRTTRLSRALAWLGAIPHWFYLTALRNDGALWSGVVTGTSAVGVLVAALGLYVGLSTARRARRAPRARWIPYPGPVRWHMMLGLVFGLTTLTWVFSGMMSMEPFEWTRADAVEVDEVALQGGPIDPAAFRLPDEADLAALFGQRVVKALELTRIDGAPVLHARWIEPDGAPGEGLLDVATLGWRTAPLGEAALLARLRAATGDAPVREATRLDHYDAYYSDRDGDLPLPVLRVRFGDPAATWVYLDVRTGALVWRNHRRTRAERWLFRGLHTMDLPGWYARRPLWDVVMILLLVGGFGVSVMGMRAGLHRTWRTARRRARG